MMGLRRLRADMALLETMAARGRMARLAEPPEGGLLPLRTERYDERALLASVLLYLACMLSMPRHALAGLAPFTLFPAALLGAGGLPWRWAARQAARALPFTLLVAIWNPLFEPGRLALPGGLSVAAGWASFAGILARSLLSVSAALALAGSLGWNGLMRAAAGLGCPQPLCALGAALFRHLHGMADTAGRLVRARALRGGGGLRPRAWAPLCGHLLLRALGRGERVERALALRGYDGRMPSLSPRRWRWTDTAWVAGWGALFAAARWWGCG